MVDNKEVDSVRNLGLDIDCLLSGGKDCQYRVYLKEVFGYDIDIECPWRNILMQVHKKK